MDGREKKQRAKVRVSLFSARMFKRMARVGCALVRAERTTRQRVCRHARLSFKGRAGVPAKGTGSHRTAVRSPSVAVVDVAR